jgi:hypothetical protein
MNNIDTKTINRSIKGQGLVFVFCALFCLIWLLSIPSVKVFAGDEGSGYGTMADAVYDWAAFVPDADKISENPSLIAYCMANGLYPNYKKIFTPNNELMNSDSDTVDRSNGRFVGS